MLSTSLRKGNFTKQHKTRKMLKVNRYCYPSSIVFKLRLVCAFVFKSQNDSSVWLWSLLFFARLRSDVLQAASSNYYWSVLSCNPDVLLISVIGPPLHDKTGSYFYLDKELQVMCLSSPWDETDWQRSAPLLMGFPAPIYFWIRVSPTSPSNNRMGSWHNGV